jgi:hypothetical protein
MRDEASETHHGMVAGEGSHRIYGMIWGDDRMRNGKHGFSFMY